MVQSQLQKGFLALAFFFSLSAQSECLKSDAWDPSIAMPSGPLEGECIYTEKQRPVKILFKKPDALNPDSFSYIFANFKHQGAYWIAELKSDAVKQVFFEEQKILGVDTLRHARLRFKLEKPLRLLWKQDARLLDNQTLLQKTNEAALEEISDIIISVEGGRTLNTRDVNWSPNEPADSYPLVAIVTSAITLETEANQGPLHAQHEINFQKYLQESETSSELSSKLLVSMINYSDKIGFSRIYHIAKRNCTTEALFVIDDLLKDRYPETPNLKTDVNRYLDAIPNLIKQRLVLRGLN